MELHPEVPLARAAAAQGEDPRRARLFALAPATPTQSSDRYTERGVMGDDAAKAATQDRVSAIRPAKRHQGAIDIDYQVDRMRRDVDPVFGALDLDQRDLSQDVAQSGV